MFINIIKLKVHRTFLKSLQTCFPSVPKTKHEPINSIPPRLVLAATGSNFDNSPALKEMEVRSSNYVLFEIFLSLAEQLFQNFSVLCHISLARNLLVLLRSPFDFSQFKTVYSPGKFLRILLDDDISVVYCRFCLNYHKRSTLLGSK